MTGQLAAIPDGAHVRDLPAVDLIATADRLAAADPLLPVALYREWIEHHPDDGLLYAISFNLGSLLSNLGALPEAAEALGEAIRLNADFLPAYINLAMVLERLGRPVDALTRLYDAVNRLGLVNAEAISHKTAALKQLGRMLGACQLEGNAEDALRQSLEVAPQHRDVLQHWLGTRQRQYKWPVVEPLASLTRARVVAGFSPLSLAAYADDPLLQLAIAADYARHDVGRPARCLAHRHRGRPRGARLRIGYLSSDLREHAIGYLMAELFELHDRGAVAVSAYYCGIPAEDRVHRRIRDAVESWVDITAMTDEAVAERIVADEIDVLVDVNGHTHSARTGVLAMRPAPVIVNWLGFPGTTGSPYHGYIIADPVLIPPENEIFYSETVKRLPCYQPNDRRRVVAAFDGTRQDAGLPDNGTVFCCFNASHKITRHVWRRWMDILRAVEGSVLWLLDGSAATNDRLRAHAEAHGVDAARIVFAPRLANAHHLARYPLADLFLDTFPYGAHTTASDALWMGTPVLTLAGRSFASRVCASLVTAAGLAELVCASGDDYVARAVALGHDRARLRACRATLRAGRESCVLFDTPLLTSRLEQLYREMWEETAAGQTRRPNLVNLDIYREIGAALDHDDVEIGLCADYRARYAQALAARDAFDMIAPDPRLWAGEKKGLLF